MPTYPIAQQLTAQALLSIQGGASFAGISAAIDGTINTQVDVTVTAAAWAVLKDGTLLSTASAAAPVPVASVGQVATVLANTTLGGNTVNGTYTLWLDHSTDGLNTPVWSIAAAAPSANAIGIATVVVAGNIVTLVTPIAQAYTPRLLTGALKFSNSGAVVLGALPANAVIDAIVVNVTTVFNAATTNTLSIGKSGGTGTEYLNASTAPATASLTVPAAQTVGNVGASPVTVTATYAQTGAAATTGALAIAIYWHQP